MVHRFSKSFLVQADPRPIFAFMLIRLLLIGLLLYANQALAEPRIWNLLEQGGQVLVMRHASTEPGVGDPAGFRLGDCSTQRNLSDAGRAEARKIAAVFSQRRIAVGDVLSSGWCRCLETAFLAFGRVAAWDGANSLFGNEAERHSKTKALSERVAAHHGAGNLVIVTHHVNIQALSGVNTAMAEIVVLTPDMNGGFKVAGKLRLD